MGGLDITLTGGGHHEQVMFKPKKRFGNTNIASGATGGLGGRAKIYLSGQKVDFGSAKRQSKSLGPNFLLWSSDLTDGPPWRSTTHDHDRDGMIIDASHSMRARGHG